MKARDVKPCAGCGRGVAECRSLGFYRVGVDYMVLDPSAIQQRAGLEMMLGGNVAIADAMGPDPDIAHTMSKTGDVLVCLECAMTLPIAALSEKVTGEGE